MRQKFLGTAGALVVLALLLVALPAAGAGDPVESASVPADFHGKAKNGIYIVRLADLPAVAYDG